MKHNESRGKDSWRVEGRTIRANAGSVAGYVGGRTDANPSVARIQTRSQPTVDPLEEKLTRTKAELASLSLRFQSQALELSRTSQELSSVKFDLLDTKDKLELLEENHGLALFRKETFYTELRVRRRFQQRHSNDGDT